MQKSIKLSGLTRKERNVAIEEIEHAVNHHGGWIADFQLYGMDAISMTVEVEFGDVHQVLKEIAKSVRLDVPLEEKVEEIRCVKADAEEEIRLLLYFTFLKKPVGIEEEAKTTPEREGK